MLPDTKIARIHALEVLDSRGNPTVEVDLWLAGGAFGRAIVPSGASTGKHEALELRDGDLARYDGKGVLRAVANVNEIIAPRLSGMPLDATSQPVVDQLLRTLDGTDDKSNLGANAILGVSLAVAHALANAQGLPLYRSLGGELATELPVPMVNLISGGQHSDWSLDFQDFLVIPLGASTFSGGLVWCRAVYLAMSQLLAQRDLLPGGVADEGGFGPRLSSNQEALGLMVDAIELAGFKPGVTEDLAIGIDVASTEFHRDGKYALSIEGRELSSSGMVNLLKDWVPSGLSKSINHTKSPRA